MSRKKLMEELTEGEVIVPKMRRRIERDASKWKILKVESTKDPDDACVTFQAGTYLNKAGMEIPVIFHCHKSGMIYREWEKEAKRRAAGGKIEEAQPYTDIEATYVTMEDKPLEEMVTRSPNEDRRPGDPFPEPKLVRIVDSQLEERQHRLNELRKQYTHMDWDNPEKDKVREAIVALEKRVLGDP
jgi:hypothetical protein